VANISLTYKFAAAYTSAVKSNALVRHKSKKSRDCAEAYAMYVSQEIPQIDTEIAQKDHFRMETNHCPARGFY
jgi:hypothetical protein